MNHKIGFAKVFHARNFPKKNSFLYKVFYLLIDIDDLQNRFKFLSFNKSNLFSFFEKDHCKHDNQGFDGNLRSWINPILKENNLAAEKIFLLCHPRILGYVFNPVSFWFCLNDKKELIAVLAEVNNTFGEAHSYLIYNQDHSPINSHQEHFSKKEFHVSPFFKRQGEYRFRFDYHQEKIIAVIDYFDEDKLVLQTSLKVDLKPVTDLALIKSFFIIPFVTLKVIFLIHYQALKLVLKGIKYVPKPQQNKNKITLINKK